jgi:phosphatidylglycerophosphatase C
MTNPSRPNSTRPSGKPPLVVFDLDGVIARDDTMAALLQRRLLSHPARAAAGALPAVAWFALHRFAWVRVRLSRALGRAALSGMTRDNYDELAKTVGARMGDDPNGSIPEGVAAIQRHLRDGDEVVVTTGTEVVLARAFLDHVGLQGVTLIGTTLRFGRRLVRYENHNLGPRKVSGFVGRDIELFYTDSDLDLSLAMTARRTILVNPDARLARLFSARVANLTIEHWASFTAS